jgi:hypothetical protein
MSNKFKFIQTLLKNEKFNPTQKERFLKLVSKELESASDIDRQVLEEIRLIKEKIKLIENEKKVCEKKIPQNIIQKKNIEIKDKFQYPRIHNVRLLVSLMNQFSDNSKALKYATHSWEHGKFLSYEDFIVKIIEEWSAISKELKSLNPRLSAKISNFLINNKLGQKKDDKHYHTWGERKLKFGWSSEELKNYMNIDKNKDPFSCPISKDTIALEENNSLILFDNYVTEFKNEIEIREDNSALEKLINNLWERELGFTDFVVNQLDTKGVSFFTDVPYLKSVLKIIFNSFKQRPQFFEINCQVYQNFDLGYLELSISQHGSKCNRSIDDPKIVNPKGGDFSSIINNLKNLADFSVIGEFNDNKIYRINYLSSNKEEKRIERSENFYPGLGFTYLLKFYI